MCRWMMGIWASPICCTKDSTVEDGLQAVNRFVWNKNNVVGGLTENFMCVIVVGHCAWENARKNTTMIAGIWL